MPDIKELKDILEKKIISSNSIIIIPHLDIDFDALASSIGLSLIASKLDKKSFIVVDDKKMNYGIKYIINNEINDINFISSVKYLKNYSKNDLFILTDVNKKNLISLDSKLLENNQTFIIDHHRTDERSVKAYYKYIFENYSSAAEIITKLLIEFGIDIPKNIATYLLSGIYLDTNKLKRNVNSRVFNTVATLLDFGADLSEIETIFIEEENSIKKVKDLINSAEILSYNIGIITGNNKIIYDKEELAKAADCLLELNVDVAFCIGYVNDNTISISARSKGRVDVAEIMRIMKGGGNKYSAATKVEDQDISEVSKQLIKIIKPNYYINNN